MENLKDQKAITIWGDSVMRGVVFDEMKNRYTLLEENCADEASRALGLTLYNRSRMGCTVTKGFEILKRDLDEKQYDSAVALIEFGGNDCDYDWKKISEHPEVEYQPKTSLSVFVSQLREMVQTIYQRGIIPVMMSLPPIDAERYFAFFTRTGLNKDNILRWLGDIQHIYHWHERYNAAVIQVAEECSCPVANVRDAFLSQMDVRDYLCVDGIHPNAKGHELIRQVLEGFGSIRMQKLYAV